MERESSPDMSRTFHANQAIQISELLTIRFARDAFGTAPQRKVAVSQPDGPSTDGGRKARQAILLSAEDGTGALMCGFIDVAQHKAEVRNYSALSQEFQARHRRPIDISRGEYDRFLQDAREFLSMQGMHVHVAHAPHLPDNRAVSGPPPGARPWLERGLFAVVGLAAGAVLGWIVFSLLPASGL